MVGILKMVEYGILYTNVHIWIQKRVNHRHKFGRGNLVLTTNFHRIKRVNLANKHTCISTHTLTQVDMRKQKQTLLNELNVDNYYFICSCVQSTITNMHSKYVSSQIFTFQSLHEIIYSNMYFSESV